MKKPMMTSSLSIMKDNNTPLHVAADSGRVAIVQMLLEGNADVHIRAKVSSMLFL